MMGTKRIYTRAKQRTLNTYFSKSVFSTNLANTGQTEAWGLDQARRSS